MGREEEEEEAGGEREREGGDAHFAALIDPVPSWSPRTGNIQRVPQLWPGGSKLHNHPVIKPPPAMASIIPGPLEKAADFPRNGSMEV